MQTKSLIGAATPLKCQPKKGFVYKFSDDTRTRPVVGRFLQPDPIGFKGSKYNLYRNYFGTNRTDPSGLCPEEEMGPDANTTDGPADGYENQSEEYDDTDWDYDYNYEGSGEGTENDYYGGDAALGYSPTTGVGRFDAAQILAYLGNHKTDIATTILSKMGELTANVNISEYTPPSSEKDDGRRGERQGNDVRIRFSGDMQMMASTLLHELTHVLDTSGAGKVDREVAAFGTEQKYYNQLQAIDAKAFQNDYLEGIANMSQDKLREWVVKAYR